MELSLLLMKKILSLFLDVMIGYGIVHRGLLEERDARPLSNLIMYVIAPCVFFSAFNQPYTADRFRGFLLTVLAGVLVHIVNILAARGLKRPLHMKNIEQASLVYTNAGNLTIPLVTSVLGEEWTFYACGYVVVQTILLWTHCCSLISEKNMVQIKKIILNPNIIAMIVSFIFFMTGFQLPALLQDTVSGLADMIGPLSMVVIGMSIAKMDLKKVFLGSGRIYLITFLRLLFFPCMIILLFRFSGIVQLHSQAREILLVSLLAASAPAAASVTQFAQIYRKDYELASSINVCTVIFCLITMPLVIMLYQMVMM
ncbi:MAG: AEC family transporter [Lachnospiraceae bacterium]|nr:AEC family transporter [Lachnospiraceae bacterium]